MIKAEEEGEDKDWVRSFEEARGSMDPGIVESVGDIRVDGVALLPETVEEGADNELVRVELALALLVLLDEIDVRDVTDVTDDVGIGGRGGFTVVAVVAVVGVVVVVGVAAISTKFGSRDEGEREGEGGGKGDEEVGLEVERARGKEKDESIVEVLLRRPDLD